MFPYTTVAQNKTCGLPVFDCFMLLSVFVAEPLTSLFLNNAVNDKNMVSIPKKKQNKNLLSHLDESFNDCSIGTDTNVGTVQNETEGPQTSSLVVKSGTQFRS